MRRLVGDRLPIMPSYTFRSGDVAVYAPEFAKPIPVHALTPEAEAAVVAVRRHGRARRLDAEAAKIVTAHGSPHVADYAGGVPAAAKRLQRIAEAEGFQVKIREDGAVAVVEGLHVARRVGFRAYWKAGATQGGTWHSGGHDHWRLVDISNRPIGVDSRTFTTKNGHRHDAGDTTRLELVESPRGVNVTITEISRRIAVDSRA